MYLKEFLLVAGVHLLGVMSPGPDFAMITRNSLVYSRRIGILSACGLGGGIMVHVTYCLLGIGVIISRSILLFNVIKYIGSAYLIYIGFKALRSRKSQASELLVDTKPEPSKFGAVRNGFFTNVLNPKATLFFLALFTQVISPETPVIIQLGYGIEMVLATTAWFCLVAMVFSHHRVRKQFERFGHWLDRCFGAILIALGIRVALSTQK